ncbi:MAG: hypothetical protein RBG13Loki_2321 [Promethearchaeota archaeon CR_4]|nr:MAG: hypothetical protein RBG13Loki_2321 [Candidatus Lokiarchaeota archaeon CR_4]
MQAIHPSLFRRQVRRYAEDLSKTKLNELSDEGVEVRKRIEDFKSRYAPWSGLCVDSPNTIFTPRSPAVLVLEQIGNDYGLYPSDAPWQSNLFLTKEEAGDFALKHFAGWEVTVPTEFVPNEEVIQALSEVFCQ